MGVPTDTILSDAPFWEDASGDVWMGLPNGEFVMVDYRHGAVRWVSHETATLASLKAAKIELRYSVTYAQAMVTILLRVVNRFESALRTANLI